MSGVSCIICKAEWPGGLRKLPDSEGQQNMRLRHLSDP